MCPRGGGRAHVAQGPHDVGIAYGTTAAYLAHARRTHVTREAYGTQGVYVAHEAYGPQGGYAAPGAHVAPIALHAAGFPSTPSTPSTPSAVVGSTGPIGGNPRQVELVDLTQDSADEDDAGTTAELCAVSRKRALADKANDQPCPKASARTTATANPTTTATAANGHDAAPTAPVEKEEKRLRRFRAVPPASFVERLGRAVSQR